MSLYRRFMMIRALVWLTIVGAAFAMKEYAVLRTNLETWMHSPTAPAIPPGAGTPTENAPVAEVSPAAAATPAAPAWTPPAVIPVIPGGTLTTPTAIYNNARIVSVEADRVTILHDGGRAIVPTWQLPEALREQLNYNANAALASEKQRPEEAPAAPEPAPFSTGPTGFAADFGGSLVQQMDGHFQPFQTSSLQGVKYWAFYYSASWCPPCRAFTPTLVEFYKQFKPTHPNFELIFVNHDESADDMLAYMRDDAMTWPAVRYDDIDRVKADRFCGSGIPDLVLVDANGKVLSDSYDGSTYLGPQKVVDDIRSMVPTP